MARFPFTVCFAYTQDETNYMADVLLPDCTDLEGLQLLRIGGTKYIEQFWDHQGFALRDPAVPGAGRGEGFHLDHHRTRQTHRPVGGVQRRDQPRGRRRKTHRP